MSAIPTEKLVITDPTQAVTEIFAFAKNLEDLGKEPRFEVHYPMPEGADKEEWEKANAETFDAVEVKNGEIFTLPPYSELEKEGSE